VFDLHFHRELVLVLRMRTARRRARALVQHSGRDEKGWLLVGEGTYVCLVVRASEGTG
jgi:hypothetical protein